MARTIYATVTGKSGQPVRISGTLDAENARVLVGLSGGGMIGFYNLARFEGGNLTPKTLAALFAPAPKVTA